MKRILKRILKVLLAIIVALLIALGVFLCKLFLIGGICDPDYIATIELTVTDDEIHTTAIFVSSANAYKGYSYRIDDDSVYLTIKDVLVSSFYRYGQYDITIKDDFSGIKKVYLEGRDQELLIWSKDE